MLDRLCKDDRDRVYAILALAEEDGPKIKPNYTKTIAEVYTDFAIGYLGYSTLFNAGSCRRGPLPANIQPELDSSYLPSWVPDLRVPATGQWSPIFGNSFATSAAHLGHMGWTRAEGFPVVVTAHGFQFDSVKFIQGIGGSDFKPTRESQSFLVMVNHIKNLRKQFVASSGYVTGELSEISWAVTLAGGYPQLSSDIDHPLHVILGTHQEAEEKLLNMWLHYQQLCIDAEGEVHKKAVAEEGDLPQNFYLNLSPEGQFAWIFHSHISSVLTQHELFLTKQNYFGLAPPGTQTGDIVAVLGGHRTPFVTRRLQGVSRTSRNCCILPHAREERRRDSTLFCLARSLLSAWYYARRNLQQQICR
jgi:hypothetical protein